MNIDELKNLGLPSEAIERLLLVTMLQEALKGNEASQAKLHKQMTDAFQMPQAGDLVVASGLLKTMQDGWKVPAFESFVMVKQNPKDLGFPSIEYQVGDKLKVQGAGTCFKLQPEKDGIYFSFYGACCYKEGTTNYTSIPLECLEPAI